MCHTPSGHVALHPGLTTLVCMAPPSLPQPHANTSLTSFFWSTDTLRSRSVGAHVLSGLVGLPALPPRLQADCERESTRLGLEAGDVEPLPWARARARWPGYAAWLHAMTEWARGLGLHQVLAASDVALMACRGARYHHDAAHYGAAAFCNLFLSEDKGLDVHFPHTSQRIPLRRGTALVFDTGQPHAVIPRQSNAFHAADFGPEQDCSQFFLSWELPIEAAAVVQALQLVLDTAPTTAQRLDAEQLWWQGAPARVSPDTGQWINADPSGSPTMAPLPTV
jgi:hypothetical protein